MTSASPLARFRNGSVVVAASAVAGAIGFVLTFLVARSIGAAAAAEFTAFWSGLYFVIGALAGVQQEIARATRPDPGAGTRALRRFSLILATSVLVAAAAVAGVWVGFVFGDRGASFVVPLTVGPVGYVLVAVVCGALYGLRQWRAIAAFIVGDAILRFVAVSLTLLVTHDVLAIAWAVALPFGGTLLILWWFVRGALGRGLSFDVSLPRLSANSAQAVVGSLATSALVSGFSLFVVATSHDIATSRLGAFVFAVTVVRAPIVVGVMSAQSLLVVTFRDRADRIRRAVVLGGAVLGAGVILAAVAALIGEPVLTALAGPSFRVAPLTLALIVLSSALLGLLFITGPFALATSAHAIYAAGTVVAALAGLGALLLPLPFAERTSLALLLAPASGVLVHVTGLWIRGRISS